MWAGYFYHYCNENTSQVAGEMAQGLCGALRGRKFSSHPPSQQLPGTPAPGHLTPSSGLTVHLHPCVRTPHTHIYTLHNTCTHIIKKIRSFKTPSLGKEGFAWTNTSGVQFIMMEERGMNSGLQACFLLFVWQLGWVNPPQLI